MTAGDEPWRAAVEGVVFAYRQRPWGRRRHRLPGSADARRRGCGQVYQDCDDREAGQRGERAELAVKKIDHSGVTGNVGPSEEIRVS